MDIYTCKQKLQLQYKDLSRDDLLWLLALATIKHQRATMLPADFREKALASMEDKSLDEIIGSLSTVNSLQKAFKGRGIRVKKADWVELVTDAICNKCCTVPERDAIKPGDLEKVLRQLKSTMDDEDFGTLVRETLLDAVDDLPENIEYPEYVDAKPCLEGEYYDYKNNRCIPILASPPSPPPIPAVAQPQRVLTRKPQPQQEQPTDMMTEILQTRLRPASERVLAPAPTETDLVDIFQRVMTGRRQALVDSDTESDNEEWE